MIARCFGPMPCCMRDVQRLVQCRPQPSCELPGSGILFKKLSALAFQIQMQRAVNEQPRCARLRPGLALLDHPRAEDMLKARAALGCWMKTGAAMSACTCYSRGTLGAATGRQPQANWCSKSGVLIVSCLAPSHSARPGRC